MSSAKAIPAVLPAQNLPRVAVLAEAVSIPWTIWLTVVGITVTLAGDTWDFGWHLSIGRDTMWTPPHIMVQTGGILVGIACGYTIMAITLAGSSPLHDASIRVLGLRAPGGAFIALWGSLAMLASEPFDNWWHNAYGLDVKIITPPHTLLSLGYFATQVGAMAWMAGIMSRSSAALRGRLKWLFFSVGSISLVVLSVLIFKPTALVNMHTAGCYLAVALFLPPIIIATGWGSTHKWGCTITAALYTGSRLGAEWLLPLFPAEPKLGPVFHNVNHLVPLPFPLLLIVPALVADLLLKHLQQRSSWIKSIYIGPAFVLSFLAVQWPFANFLISPASRNWIFGTTYFAYQDPAGILYDPYKFNADKTLSGFLLTMAVAVVASIVTARLGLAWGNWMQRLRR